MVAVYKMTQLEDYYARSNTIGMISSEYPFATDHRGYRVMLLTFYTSVRSKVRDEAEDYSASQNYWIRCLYEGGQGNPEDVEKGFLKGELLVRVRPPHHHSDS